MSLKRFYVTSNASRQRSIWTSKWYDRATPSALTYRKKSKAGRSSLTGQIIVWTKSSYLKRIKLPNVNYSFRHNYPSFISTFKLVPYSNKLLALVIFPSGCLSYFPAVDSMKIFSPLIFRSGRAQTSLKALTPHYSFIYTVKPFQKVSNIEIRPGKGVQYVRSAGTWAKITKFDNFHHAVLVKLPSGMRKFFSFYSLIVLGPCALKLKKKLTCTRSGLWRSFGNKPKVRGVARNPVDHPHGGRTKSIKYPRTPWGKTTKYK